MKFIKDRKWIIATVFLSIFLIYTVNSLYPIESNQLLKFDGNVDTFYFVGNETYVNFESKILSLSTNEVAFNYITNIEFKDDTKVINIENKSILLVKFNGTQSLQLNDANLNIKFNNLAMQKEIGITLNGNLNNNYLNFLFFNGDNSVDLKKSEVENVMVIKNNTITEVFEFDELTFKMDTSSTIGLKSYINNLQAVGISNLNIFSNASEVEIERSQGDLMLNNHKFDVEKIDTLNIIISQNHHYFNLNVKETSMILRNASNSAKLNNRDLIMSDFSYWLYKIPETVFSGINATALIILVILTGWYAHSTKSMLKEQRSTLDEQRKTRKITALEKKLEKVYSQIEKTLTEFDLESNKFLTDNPNYETLPTEIKDIFEKLIENMLAVKKHYGHLIDFDTTDSFRDVWSIYLSLDRTTDRKQTDTFIALIKVFHSHISTKISKYNKQLKDLQ